MRILKKLFVIAEMKSMRDRVKIKIESFAIRRTMKTVTFLSQSNYIMRQDVSFT